MMKKKDTIILVVTSLVCVATVLFLSLRDPNSADPTSIKTEPGHVPPPGGGFVEEDEAALKMLFLGSFEAGDNDLTGLIESADFTLIGHSAAGLGAEAAEAPYRFEAKVGGLPFHVAIFAVLQPLKVKDLVARIDALKKAEPDLFVIVAPHWGRRFRWADRKQQGNARKLIDAGADMIIGHGSNMVQEIEHYNDRWILYGIGSIGQSSPDEYKETRKAVPYSFAVRLEVREKEGSLHKTLRLYPIISKADRSKPGSRFLSAREMGDFYWAMLEKTTRIDRWMKRSFILKMDRHGRHLEILADVAEPESE